MKAQTMNLRNVITLVVVAALATACVSPPQKPVSLSQDSALSNRTKLGIAMTTSPKVEMQYPGAGCLLCLAFAAASNSTLSRYTETLPKDDLLAVKGDIATAMRKKGMDVVVIDEDLNLRALPDTKTKGDNVAKQDFSSLKDKYKIEKLLVIDIAALGTLRNYSAYIPTSDPKSYIHGVGYIVDLSDNSYKWYLPVDVSKSAEGNWDEPPNFPGLTNAYFQAIELSKDVILKDLSN